MIKIRATSAPWWDGIEFLLMDLFEPDKISYATNVVFTYDESNKGAIIDPSFKLDREQAQVLMDDLWQCGLRPSEGTGSAGALAATQKHLEDMRKLVFKHEGI